MEFYSALLVFKMESPTDLQFRKKLESIVVFEAADFAGAEIKAIEIGTKRAAVESVRNAAGEVVILLTFCYVATLDLTRKTIEGIEVWSKLSDVNQLPEICTTKPSVQTI